MSSNSAPPIPFTPKPSAIPIVGQPFHLKGFFATVMLQCNCEAREPVMLIGTGPGSCKSCGRTFLIGSVSYNVNDPQNAQIGVAVVRNDPQG